MTAVIEAAPAEQVRRSYVDLNIVLIVLNIAVAVATLGVFSRFGINEFVDSTTITLAVLLCVQTIIALVVERSHRDPFVILVAFAMTLYYSVRIVTLTIFPFSTVFLRYPFDSGDTNYALTYILIANVLLYAGLHVVKLSGPRHVDTADWTPRAPYRVVVLLIAAIAFTYLTGSYWAHDNIPRAFSFLTLFLAPNAIVLIVLSYFVVYRRALPHAVGLAIIVLILVNLVLQTLVGSRSAIVGIVTNCILVGLAFAGTIRIRTWRLVALTLTLPVVIPLMGAAFLVATYNRANKDYDSSINVGTAMQMASEAGNSPKVERGLDLVLPPMLARAGFFDLGAEIIAHRSEYTSIIEPSAYFRSIVDNLLTPGFDVYDQPKIANAMQFAYEGLGQPSKLRVSDAYQSDQLTLYGELYALFAYASLPLYFLFGWGCKRVYKSLAYGGNPYVFTMKRLLVLYFFFEWLNSFGLDWVICDSVPIAAAMYLYSRLLPAWRTGDVWNSRRMR
jgi:hypothetical protein